MFSRPSTRLLIATAAAALTAGACSSSSFNFASPARFEAPAPATTADTAATTTADATPTAAATLTTPTTAATTPPATAPPAITQTAGAGPCHARVEYGYVLPDPACTPGATNPQVTQADIGTTICSTGWTNTVRPPESYTEPLKRSQMAEYGENRSITSYEEDHLIPLEIGGAPSDPHNLWPEPGSSPNTKDDVEYVANRAVCDGTLTLADAQHQIATDWVVLGRSFGVITGPGDQSP